MKCKRFKPYFERGSLVLIKDNDKSINVMQLLEIANKLEEDNMRLKTELTEVLDACKWFRIEELNDKIHEKYEENEQLKQAYDKLMHRHSL